MDSPFHRFEQGLDLSGLPLERLVNLPGVVLHTPANERAIASTLFEQTDLSGKAVLIHTRWDKNWRTDAYFFNHPFLTKEAAECLVQQGATLVGIDSYNIDDTGDMKRPAHTVLLLAGIPIVEHLCNLEGLPPGNFRFFAAPPRIKRFGTFPVRAFAIAD